MNIHQNCAGTTRETSPVNVADPLGASWSVHKCFQRHFCTISRQILEFISFGSIHMLRFDKFTPLTYYLRVFLNPFKSVLTYSVWHRFAILFSKMSNFSKRKVCFYWPTNIIQLLLQQIMPGMAEYLHWAYSKLFSFISFLCQPCTYFALLNLQSLRSARLSVFPGTDSCSCRWARWHNSPHTPSPRTYPRCPSSNLCAQIRLKSRSPKEKDWSMKVPSSFSLPPSANFITPASGLNARRNEPTALFCGNII